MQPAKRVNIVSLKLVRESSVLYKERHVKLPEDAYKLLKPFLADADQEVVVVVCLDTKNQPTAIHVCHVGSLNASIVHPREVFKSAILANAASILVAHNHPSTDPTPSGEDIEVTRRLVEAGRIHSKINRHRETLVGSLYFFHSYAGVCLFLLKESLMMHERRLLVVLLGADEPIDSENEEAVYYKR